MVDADDLQALVSVHDEVFGDHSGLADELRAGLAREPAAVAAVVAWAQGTPIAAGRVEFHAGADVAGLWGGGTVAAWRGRGVFGSLVAHRAALAATRGVRDLHVDASADSGPILERLGFVELATTTRSRTGRPATGLADRGCVVGCGTTCPVEGAQVGAAISARGRTPPRPRACGARGRRRARAPRATGGRRGA